METATVMSAQDNALGRLDRLREAIARCETDHCVVGNVPAIDASADAIVLVSDAGAPPANCTFSDLLTSPAPWPAAAFPTRVLREAPLPACGPPDCLLDDHATWIIAAWACAHGAAVVARGVPPDGHPALTPAGRAWLAQHLIARLATNVLAAIDLTAVMRPGPARVPA